MSKSRKLDKFYTKPEVVNDLFGYEGKWSEEVFEFIEFERYSNILEPSAGSGNFSNFLTRFGNVLAFDICPEDENVLEKDFLKDKIEIEENTIVIGNPPFGKQCSMAVKFFNRAASYQNISTIAFILPRSFKKKSLQDKLDLNFILKLNIDLEPNSFVFENNEVDVPCVFQIWQRTETRRTKSEKKELDNNMVFLKYEDCDENTVAIRRVGVYAGKAYLFKEQSKQSHYFVKHEEPSMMEKLLCYLNEIVWLHNDTTGPRSISKQQFIEKLNEFH
jgi:hypothetical protein